MNFLRKFWCKVFGHIMDRPSSLQYFSTYPLECKRWKQEVDSVSFV